MAAVDLVAATVMDMAAALMNDSIKSVYTYSVQVPYLQMALQELQEHYELNKIPSTQAVTSIITIPAGTTQIIYNGGGNPTLPNGFIEPVQLWESPTGQGKYIPMVRKSFLPLYSVAIAQFGIYAWIGNTIQFPASTQINDIKINYVQDLFTDIVDQNSIINVVNGRSFLEYRTAGLLAEFIERNLTSSNAMNAYAEMALQRATGIGVKGKQSIVTRRRPFRQSYKSRIVV